MLVKNYSKPFAILPPSVNVHLARSFLIAIQKYLLRWHFIADKLGATHGIVIPWLFPAVVKACNISWDFSNHYQGQIIVEYKL